MIHNSLANLPYLFLVLFASSLVANISPSDEFNYIVRVIGLCGIGGTLGATVIIIRVRPKTRKEGLAQFLIGGITSVFIVPGAMMIFDISFHPFLILFFSFVFGMFAYSILPIIQKYGTKTIKNRVEKISGVSYNHIDKDKNRK